MVGIVFKGEVPLGPLVDLRGVSETGKIPGEKASGHRDGWGMVSFSKGSPLYIGRSSRWAFQDPSFDSALSDIAKIEPPNILIAHVRAFSKGKASIENTHPFVMDGLVLAHNGTVEGLGRATRHKPKGGTDSELLLAHLADLVEEKKDLRAALRSLIVDVIPRDGFTAAILLVSDGKRLYAYRDYGKGKSSQYYDLRIARHEDYVILFQESRLEQSCELPGIRKGELVIMDTDLNIERELIR